MNPPPPLAALGTVLYGCRVWCHLSSRASCATPSYQPPRPSLASISDTHQDLMEVEVSMREADEFSLQYIGSRDREGVSVACLAPRPLIARWSGACHDSAHVCVHVHRVVNVCMRECKVIDAVSRSADVTGRTVMLIDERDAAYRVNCT
jgi:hypothetical protein